METPIGTGSGGVPAELSRAAFGPEGDTWVVDVTEWEGPIDPALIRRIGRPVLVCFGGHAVCPLGADGGHGIVIEVAAERRADAMFADRFRNLIRAGVPVVIRERDHEDQLQVSALTSLSDSKER